MSKINQDAQQFGELWGRLDNLEVGTYRGIGVMESEAHVILKKIEAFKSPKKVELYKRLFRIAQNRGLEIRPKERP